VARHIVLLRGINIGPRNRIAMPDLRDALAEAGFDDVQTYVQSGNVVLSSTASPTRVAETCRKEIMRRFKLEIAVVVRTRSDLEKVVKRNPLGDVADDPKRYQVSFLEGKLDRTAAERVKAAVVEPEQVVILGREIYAWHPKGVARSKLWTLLAGKGLGVTATARNWTTVTKLLELADA
jgi:uncharacterized protein (DUF1697 family)